MCASVYVCACVERGGLPLVVKGMMCSVPMWSLAFFSVEGRRDKPTDARICVACRPELCCAVMKLSSKLLASPEEPRIGHACARKRVGDGREWPSESVYIDVDPRDSATILQYTFVTAWHHFYQNVRVAPFMFFVSHFAILSAPRRCGELAITSHVAPASARGPRAEPRWWVDVFLLYRSFQQRFFMLGLLD